MARKGGKAPYLSDMDNVRVRDAFAHLTRHKDECIIHENGRKVDVQEAVRRYKETRDEKWVLHILMSNLGYFANALSKVAARWGIEPSDYVPAVYEGLKISMDKADPERVRLSYLSTGVFMYCRRLAEKEVRERNGEAKLGGVIIESDDGRAIDDIDMMLAMNGIYEVSLPDDEAPHEADSAQY